MESTCSSSSIVKDELPNTKEKSKKREKYMGGLLDRINGKKNDNHEKKRVPTKSKGYNLDEIILMMKKKHIKQ